MVSSYTILALAVIGLVAWVVVRAGATALRLTGVSADAAGFQAVSGFFGVGFTTSEAEMIVGHPVRRRIMTHLIIAGNLGVTSGLATIVVAFVDAHASEEGNVLATLGLFVGIVVALVLAARTRLLNRVMDAVIGAAMQRTGAVRALDYETVLRTSRGFVVEEFGVPGGHEIAGRTLRQSALRERGILVLGVERADGGFVGTPQPETRVDPGDVLTVYGREGAVARVLGAPGATRRS